MPDALPPRPRCVRRSMLGLLTLLALSPGCAPSGTGAGELPPEKGQVNQRQRDRIEKLMRKPAGK